MLTSWGGTDLSPQEYFGDSYNEAVTFLNSKAKEFDRMAVKYGIEQQMAMSIVFPEIIRYNRFRDFAETTVLELTYVDGGRLAADFSIGRFQMKPSFVETLETIILENESLSQFAHIAQYDNPKDIKLVRAERLKRLKQHQWQMEYLACFIAIGKSRFATIIQTQPNEELLILSSLYNLSIDATYEQLQKTAQNKTFPYGRFSPTNFSYFDVAYYFYTNHSSSI